MLEISKKNTIIGLGIILAISFFLHLGYMNMDVQGGHSWRQCQTMWNVNNFARYDANILNPRVSHFNGVNPENLYRYEFPIMQWTIGMTMRIFGEHSIIMRLYMFLFSSLGLLGFFNLSKFILKKRINRLISTFFLSCSPVYFYYSICPLPDVLALSVSMWYLYFIIEYFERHKLKNLLLASFCLLIATFAKLPYLMFSIVSIFYFFRSIRDSKTINKINFKQAIIQFCLLIPAFLWYKWVIPTWSGNSIVKGILDIDLSFGEIFHIIQFNMLELLPMSIMYPGIWIFFIWGLIHYLKNRSSKKWISPLILITFIYYAFEFNAIQVQHDYYLMPFITWVFLIVGLGIESFLDSVKLWKKITFGILIISAPIFVFLVSQKKYSIEGYYDLQDAVRYKTELRNAVPQDEKCLIIEDISNFIFSYQIDKRGYVFGSKNIPIGWVSDLIRNKNVQYVYSNSREFDENPLFINHYAENEILHRGSIKIFKLKSKMDIVVMENILKYAISKSSIAYSR